MLGVVFMACKRAQSEALEAVYPCGLISQAALRHA
jgi:hypothetical protein